MTLQGSSFAIDSECRVGNDLQVGVKGKPRVDFVGTLDLPAPFEVPLDRYQTARASMR
jgi:hypothetical protein